MRWRPLLALAVVPLVAYPLMAGSLLAADALVGQRFLGHYVRYEQRLLWDTFWADYVASLSFMYVLVAVAVAAFLLVGRASGRPLSPFLLVPLFALVGWAGATFLIGALVGSGHIALTAAGALLGFMVAVPLRVLRKQPEGMFLP